jgi:hypothetical protein
LNLSDRSALRPKLPNCLEIPADLSQEEGKKKKKGEKERKERKRKKKKGISVPEQSLSSNTHLPPT